MSLGLAPACPPTKPPPCCKRDVGGGAPRSRLAPPGGTAMRTSQLVSSSCRPVGVSDRNCFETVMGCFETPVAETMNSRTFLRCCAVASADGAGTVPVEGAAVAALRPGSFTSLVLFGAAALLAGCLTAGDPVPADDADAVTDVATESVVVATDSAADVGALDASPDGVEADVEADGAETTASVDAEPDVTDGDAGATEAETPASTTCGDGVRDLTGLEECDFATTSLRAICQSCRSVDLLALPAPSAVDAGVPLGKRSLGFGRHTVAGDPAGGFAVVFAEDKPWRLLLTRFDSKGVASDVSTSFAADAAPLLAANPVIALADSGWVTAWTDLSIDGDGPGIAPSPIRQG